MQDKRFEIIAKDPKFKRPPKKKEKTKIDKRFQSMFTDKKFEFKYKTDERGRPVKHHSTTDLKKYYDISSEEDENSDSENESSDEKNESGRYVRAPLSDSDVDDDDVTNRLDTTVKSDKKVSDVVKKRLKNLNIDYARGETNLLSDSSSDDEESDEEVSESEEIDHKWGELDADAGSTDEVTYRLAACNMDWDRIKAVDLMVLFNSFLPKGGVIKSVEIFPSEFGKKRMQEEDTKGPIELVESKPEETTNESEEGSKYHMEKLRQYQLNRLKYYYAVITFDSPDSANKVYTECDGMEYESSSTKIDLRFIPDDMTFDDTPKEVCTQLPEVSKYKPRFFTTTALQQAKVDLTWDETDPDRLEIAEKLKSGKIEDISQVDLKNYLAGSSSEEEENSEEENEDSSEDVIGKYKALLNDLENKEKSKKEDEVEMEISWGIGLKEKTDKIIEEKNMKSEEKTPFEQYLDKRKQKRKEKKKKKQNDSDSDVPSDIDMNDPYFAEEFNNSEFKSKKNSKKSKDNDVVEQNSNKDELELLLMNEDKESNHFNLKKIQDNENESKSKKKRKKKDQKQKIEDNFEVNVKDERFSALFTSHHFNIDPTDPHYKKTKNMDILVHEKLKRRKEENDDTYKNKNKPQKNTELNMLVKSVKRKASEAFKK